MYTFLKKSDLGKSAAVELPSFGIAMITAEFLYKFGSFILECIAFMITWYITSFVIDKLSLFIRRHDK